MRVQVLVATMNQDDYSLLEKMNIRTDAIIANQCNRNEFEEFEWKGSNIKWISLKEKGVGLNRNNALMRATGDICLFADDDMIYVDNYEKIVKKAFKQIPNADVIIFNLVEKVKNRYIIPKAHRINYFNYLRYGTARIAIKTKSVKLSGIYFNQCFGGGTQYCHGEDNLFLTDCLKKGLKVYAYPAYIAKLTDERESTWDNVPVEKYLKDQGKLYRQISRRFWKLLCLQDVIRRKKTYGMSWKDAYRIMKSNVLS